LGELSLPRQALQILIVVFEVESSVVSARERLVDDSKSPKTENENRAE
jgi:hypothetical protein